MLRYAAIAANCKKREPAPDDIVGDLPMRKLRARFGSQPNRPGLIYANGSWFVPSKVFRGAPIFGRLRPFVSERSAAEQLWRALRIPPPSITDCVDVLNEIAQATSDDQDEILVNTYVYLEQQLPRASTRELTRLRGLPLWNGSVWQADRPIYVIAHGETAQALSSHVAVWDLPVAPAAVPRLIAATNATLLAEDDFNPVVHEGAFVPGATLERHFEAAVDLLRDWLARRDPKLFGALSMPWEKLARAQIAIDPQLQIELRLNRRMPVSVAAQAHLMRTPLAFYFADSEAPGEADAGGRVIARLFTEGDRDKLALAWSDSWHKAAKGERGAVTLVQDRADGGALDSLFEQAKGTTPITRRAKAKQAHEAPKTRTAAEPSLPVRRLKRIEDLSEKIVDVAAENNEIAAKQSRRRGLRDDVPVGKRIGESRPAPQSAPLAYSAEEKEDLALKILQSAINGDSAELRDYHHLRGIGADALDKLGRYFEIKASFGEIPDDVTLLGNQVERALREGNKFSLAVVAGLEEGYDTVVKIFPNPLRTLKPKPNTSVTLTGITECKALTVRFPPPGSGLTAPEVSVEVKAGEKGTV